MAVGRRRWLDLACCLVLLVPGWLAVRALARVGWSCGFLQNPFDVGLVGYLLEWGYQFLGGSDLSASIWSPPFFFPEPNTLAYSDTFFTAYPFYFPARWLGADPHEALLFFWVAQLCLTPVVAYAIARWLGLGRLAALVCAGAFGWSWARYFHTAHIQFSAGWPIPLFFALLYRGIRDRRPGWLGAALAAWVAEFYLSVYIAYFLGITAALVVACAAALEYRHLRAYLRAFARDLLAPPRRREVLATAASAALALALLAPGVAHYREAARALGGGDPQDLISFGASLSGWFRPAEQNLVWGGLSGWFAPEPLAPWEKMSFVGWVALLLCLASPALLARRPRAWFGWQGRAAVHPTVLASLSLCVLFVIAFVSDYPPRFDFLEQPMDLARRIVPGATAIRATGRICLVLSFFSSFVAASWVHRLSRSRHRAIAVGSVALAAVLVLENLAAVPDAGDRCEVERPWRAIEPRIAEIARAEGLGTVLFLPVDVPVNPIARIFGQTPAMALSLRTGLRTINGYNGHWPPRLAPLFVTHPRVLRCPVLRQALDDAHAALPKPALVYVEQDGPLGPPAYPVDEVPRCLSACLADAPPLAIEGEARRGIGWITDPARRCSDAAAGGSDLPR